MLMLEPERDLAAEVHADPELREWAEAGRRLRRQHPRMYVAIRWALKELLRLVKSRKNKRN